MSEQKPLGITDVVLRDAHQSLLATRMRIDDMLPIAEKLDQIGFWSLETWGGATFDAGGAWAAEHDADESLLSRLLEDLAQPP